MKFVSVAPLIPGLLLIAALAGAEEKKTAGAEEMKPAGKVEGRIACGENCRGVASLWETSGPAPDPRRYIVIPVSVTSLKPDGSFRLSAPPGRYYVGAIVRSNPESRVGPPRPGDRVFMTPDAAGKFKVVEVRAGETLDIGVQDGGWIYEGFSKTEGPGIAGRVVSMEDKPLPGLLVFAFKDPEMSGTPIAVSERTGADGTFRLRLPSPGTVYLRVMENYGGGRPSDGGYMGVYGGGEPKALTVEGEKTVEGITIDALRLPPMKNPDQPKMKPAGR